MKFFERERKNKPLWGDDVEMEDDFGYDDVEGASEDDGMDDSMDTPMSPVAPSPSFNANPVSLKIVSPKAYEDAHDITEFLMNGNTVLLNMDGINRELAMRVIDYLRGAVQVVGGMITKVGKTTLVVAPKNVDVSSIEAMVGSEE